MKARIQDTEALIAVSPVALSAYARAAGWEKVETYGDHSDVYAADGMPEIILPRTHLLGDYAYVVSQLIEIFASIADTDELAIYRDLVTADRDVVRVRAIGENDGAVEINDGVALILGARDMFLAAACSLRSPRPLYRTGANKEANEYLRGIRMGQTEHGSFVITLLTPVVSPPPQHIYSPYQGDYDEPVERKITRRLAEALVAVRGATEKMVGGGTGAFSEAVNYGISANLCEALAQLVEPFPGLDISLDWALTRPIESGRDVFRFAKDDALMFKEAARSLRERHPQSDVRLRCSVLRLSRDESKANGTIHLRTSIDGQPQSVKAVLNQSDYNRAIRAHQNGTQVVASGDLKRVGHRWHLLTPHIIDDISSGYDMVEN